MSNWKLLSGVAAATLFTAAIVAPAEAQVTSAGIRGDVVSPTGEAVPGATVRVVDTRTGSTSSSTTSPTGQFTTRGLQVGGPYTVEISAPGYQTTRITDVTLQLGETANLNLVFAATDDAADGEARMDTVTVSATSGGFVQTAIGPSATFSLADIENSPAINRDLKDIVRLDPRVYLDESFNDSIQCAGAHPRYNSLTVDGIGLNDGFGLNSNGYPTQQMPFPFDAIQNVSVELAPFDVEYGSFTACNINAVTKSGTNEFHGSAFFDYGDESLIGDSTEGDEYAVPAFEEKRYGFTLGGPILKDRLFFFGAYEKFEGPGNEINRVPEGSGIAGQEVTGFTQAKFDEIRDIAQNVYGYNPGGIPTSTGTEDEKYLVRLDWNITNNHRASFTYNYNEGFNLTESDGDSNEFEYSNHLYNRGAELKAYSGQVFSDWSDNFSTELRYSYNDVTFLQSSVGGTDFGEVQIFDGNNVYYLGADDSRHANELKYSVGNYKALGRYTLDNHNFTIGGERLEYDVFNLFVQEAEGEYRFNSIDDFRNGIYSRITYENAVGTNNAADAAASFKYAVNTLYLQDEWTGPNGLTVTGGLRYDFYSSDDKPRYNQDFFDKYGFRNDENMDGRDLLMPRVGFTWDYKPNLSFRGGFGLYSGGNPNVWISNNYSNNGVTQVEFQDRNPTGQSLLGFTYVNDEGGSGRPIFGIPQQAFDFVANAAVSGPVNALDPNFEIPSEWKFALGFTSDLDIPGLGSGYVLNGDVLWSNVNQAPLVKAISLNQVGTAPDGRPIYDENTDDFVLTNTDEGSTFVASLGVSNTFDFDAAGELDWSLGYAYTDAEDVNPMTSSVAFSNWSNLAAVDPNNPGLGTSNYEIPHRFTLRLSWEKEFFGELATRATLFGQAWQARPYSITFNDGPFGDDSRGRSLLYVPIDGSSDPLIDYANSSVDWDAFFRYTDGQGLGRGSIASRNEGEGQWNNKFDLRLEQELPGLMSGHESSVFMVMENVGNFLNEDWGTYYQAGFPQTTSVVDAEIVGGQYVYSDFSARNPERRTDSLSVWSVRFGVKYEF